MKVILANPRGFCAGVDRAIAIVDRALELFGAPIYVRHEVVHNRFVVDNLRQRGAIFVDEIAQIPEQATVIFSAHGVAQQVKSQTEQRQLQVFDATCPLVTKVHMEVASFSKKGIEVILIGHAGHPEVEGTMGQYHGEGIYLVENVADVAKLTVHNPDLMAYVTQTTLSVDDTQAIITALKQRFPKIHEPKKDDICYATQNRQDAVKQLAQSCDMVLVVGSANSSNSNRLKEIVTKVNKPSYLIDGADDIDVNWIENCQTIGVTAGASAPEILVEQVLERLKQWGAEFVENQQGKQENIVFSLPKELR